MGTTQRIRSLCLLGIGIAIFSTCISTDAAVIATCDEAHLREALNAGGSFSFACDSTILLGATLLVTNNVILNGSGHTITIDGSNAVRIFQVNPGASLTLLNLSLVNGKYVGTNGSDGLPGRSGEPARGGAILIDNGILHITGCMFSNNVVLAGAGGNNSSLSSTGAGAGGNGEGGGIASINGLITIANCLFASNQAIGAAGGYSLADSKSSPPGDSFGGAIFSSGGTVLLTNSVFLSNASTGTVAGRNMFGTYGSAGNAWGGAIHSRDGVLNLEDCWF
ncbi:MAG TPA: hypothetical protein VMZ27_04415 [Candidatus Saccharimonadales bacterium]|nr:hypothetical protein [Candidatus Saccharimonadales bacterium]